MKTTTRRVDASRLVARCPVCGAASKRHSIRDRRIREVGTDGPVEILLTFSIHRCETCAKFFTAPTKYVASGRSRYTVRVRRAALDLLSRGDLTIEQVRHRMRQRYYVSIGATTVFDWKVEALREVKGA